MKCQMTRLMSAALALVLLSGTAANADPWGHGPRGGYHGYSDRGWDHRRHHDDGVGTAVAVGVGLFALTAIIAAADRDRERTRYVDEPPPPPVYRDGSYDTYPQDRPAYGDDRYGPRDDRRYDDRDPRD